jgi:hypothetical protein
VPEEWRRSRSSFRGAGADKPTIIVGDASGKVR